MLSFYTAERIIELLLDTKLIRKCILSNIDLQGEYEQGEIELLFITDIGRYWIVPVAIKNSGLITSVMVFDANTGERIVDTKVMVLVRKWGDRQLNQMSNSPLILTSRFV